MGLYGSVAAVAAGVVAGVVALVHSTDPVYGIPPWGQALTAGLLGLVLAGGVLLVRSRRRRAAGVLLAGVSLLVVSLLGALTIGILVLPFALGLLAWAAARREDRDGLATTGAVLAGVPLPLLVIVALGGPVVDCGRDGTAGGESVFMGLASSGVSSRDADSPDGTATGRASSDAYEYSYACRDGRLARFSLRWK